MSEQAFCASSNTIDDAMVKIFLNSLYDEMIFLNATGNFGKVLPWNHLRLPFKDYLEMSKNPEKWAKEYLERISNGWGIE